MNAGVRALLSIAAYLVTAAALRTFGPYARVEAISGRLGLPEERPGISPAAVSVFLGRIGADGRALYMQAVILDFALPALMALAGWLTVRWARTLPAAPPLMSSLLARVTILAVAAEIIENGLLLIAAERHPLRPLLGHLIGAIVSAKFALIALTGVSLLALVVTTVVRTRSRTSAGYAGR